MQLGKVVGTVVSTRKNECLIGKKLLVVKELDEKLNGIENTFVSIDTVGAGLGETVLICNGSAARIILGEEKTPADSAIVGIVDSV